MTVRRSTSPITCLATQVTVHAVLPGPPRTDGIVDFLKSLASDPEAPLDRIEDEFFAKGRPSSLLQQTLRAKFKYTDDLIKEEIAEGSWATGGKRYTYKEKN